MATADEGLSIDLIENGVNQLLADNGDVYWLDGELSKIRFRKIADELKIDVHLFKKRRIWREFKTCDAQLHNLVVSIGGRVFKVEAVGKTKKPNVKLTLLIQNPMNNRTHFGTVIIRMKRL